MDGESRKPEEMKDATSALNAAIEAMDLAKRLSTIAPARDVFGSVSVSLTMLRVSSFCFFPIDCGLESAQDTIMDEADYVELGLACADVCTVLNRKLDGWEFEDLSNSVCKTIAQLTT